MEKQNRQERAQERANKIKNGVILGVIDPLKISLATVSSRFIYSSLLFCTSWQKRIFYSCL